MRKGRFSAAFFLPSVAWSHWEKLNDVVRDYIKLRSRDKILEIVYCKQLFRKIDLRINIILYLDLIDSWRLLEVSSLQQRLAAQCQDPRKELLPSQSNLHLIPYVWTRGFWSLALWALHLDVWRVFRRRRPFQTSVHTGFDDTPDPLSPSVADCPLQDAQRKVFLKVSL